jgi:hypothetical protein
MTKSRRKFLCLDCKVDTGKIKEHYFIRTDLWLSVVGSKKGMLCIGCLQKRVKRPLVKADFTDCYINSPSFEPKSQRLMEILQ